MTKRRTKALKTARTGTPIAGANRTRKRSNGATLPIKPLDAEDALDLIDEMRDHQAIFRKLAHRFDVGDGHKALGYQRRRDCIRKELLEFGSEAHIYRQLAAAGVEQNLVDLLPTGRAVPERILLALKPFTPQQQRKIYAHACQKSGMKIPTPRDIKKAIAKLSGKSSPTPGAGRAGTRQSKGKS
jgi:hypothetical protein